MSLSPAAAVRINLRMSRAFSACAPLANKQSALTQLNQRIDNLITHYEDFNGINRQKSQQDIRGTNMVKFNDSFHKSAQLDKLRIVPRDHAFYMANPPHEMIMRKLKDMLNKHINLPTVSEQQRRSTWISLDDYAVMAGGTRLRPSDYRDFVKLAARLDSIDSQLIPMEVTKILDVFKRQDISSGAAGAGSASSLTQLDANGRAISVGRRKTSSAKVIVVKSQDNIRGQFLVNGKPLDAYFPRLHDRTSVIYPLRVVEALDQYNVFATVQGGGTTGQADAIALGLTKSLIVHNPLLARRLGKAECTTRDSRSKERKKPGKPKARKSNTWVKR